MNQILYPVFALLFSVALFGFILDRQGYATRTTDREGNETDYTIYKYLLEKVCEPLLYVYMFFVGLIFLGLALSGA